MLPLPLWCSCHCATPGRARQSKCTAKMCQSEDERRIHRDWTSGPWETRGKWRRRWHHWLHLDYRLNPKWLQSHNAMTSVKSDGDTTQCLIRKEIPLRTEKSCRGFGLGVHIKEWVRPLAQELTWEVHLCPGAGAACPASTASVPHHHRQTQTAMHCD